MVGCFKSQNTIIFVNITLIIIIILKFKVRNWNFIDIDFGLDYDIIITAIKAVNNIIVMVIVTNWNYYIVGKNFS